MNELSQKLALVIDLSLSPEWVVELEQFVWSAVHWSSIGKHDAEDAVIVEWVVEKRRVVFTHNLDFGTKLALTHAFGPSVLQVRGQEVLPEDIGPLVVAALQKYAEERAAGALVIVDQKKPRVRVLPL